MLRPFFRCSIPFLNVEYYLYNKCKYQYSIMSLSHANNLKKFKKIVMEINLNLSLHQETQCEPRVEMMPANRKMFNKTKRKAMVIKNSDCSYLISASYQIDISLDEVWKVVVFCRLKKNIFFSLVQFSTLFRRSNLKNERNKINI